MRAMPTDASERASTGRRRAWGLAAGGRRGREGSHVTGPGGSTVPVRAIVRRHPHPRAPARPAVLLGIRRVITACGARKMQQKEKEIGAESTERIVWWVSGGSDGCSLRS
jgi:hypothetical protein